MFQVLLSPLDVVFGKGDSDGPTMTIKHYWFGSHRWVTEGESERLHAALLGQPDDRVLGDMSASGSLAAILPAWARMTGSENTQHRLHDFPLDVHTLKVVAGTRQSPYYSQLRPSEQRWVTMAALLHDIAKCGGPRQARDTIPVDRYHPFKSDAVARQTLPHFGYTLRTTEHLCRLIRHHQLFGTMIVTHKPPDANPEPGIIARAAQSIRNRADLQMLRALTEGDIRGVRADDRLFDVGVATKLERYSGLVEAELARSQQHGGLFFPELALNQWVSVQWAEAALCQERRQEMDTLLDGLTAPPHVDSPRFALAEQCWLVDVGADARFSGLLRLPPEALFLEAFCLCAAPQVDTPQAYTLDYLPKPFWRAGDWGVLADVLPETLLSVDFPDEGKKAGSALSWPQIQQSWWIEAGLQRVDWAEAYAGLLRRETLPPAEYGSLADWNALSQVCDDWLAAWKSPLSVQAQNPLALGLFWFCGHERQIPPEPMLTLARERRLPIIRIFL
jgi:hypothetical protein